MPMPLQIEPLLYGWLLPALHEVEPLLYGLTVISPNWSVGYVIWVGGCQPHMKWKDCHMNWQSPISHELERLSYELVVASPNWNARYTIWIGGCQRQ